MSTSKFRSPYTIYHALAAAAVLFFAIRNNFWHTFLHGMSMGTPRPPVLALMLLCQTALFGLLALFIWISTLFTPADVKAAAHHAAPDRLKAVKTALAAFVPICLATFALEWGCTAVMEKAFGLELAGQDIVRWLKPGVYPLPMRLGLMAFVLFEAPLLEEPLFRGIVFRGLASAAPMWSAAAASAFVFAVVHVNAATFIPLMFLGMSFAWLYRRTGSILAPMTAHFLFNALNLALCLAFPDAVP